jgi:hypothetical protein
MQEPFELIPQGYLGCNFIINREEGNLLLRFQQVLGHAENVRFDALTAYLRFSGLHQLTSHLFDKQGSVFWWASA